MLNGKNNIQIVLILLLIMVVFISCSEKVDDTPNTTQSNIVTNTEREIEEEEINYVSSMPDFDFDGYEFRFLTVSAGINETTRFTDEIWVEHEIGEVINDAVYQRNQIIEEKLNVLIRAIPTTSIFQMARSSVLAGDQEFEMIGAYKSESVTLATEGLLRNWNDIPILDFDNPWWSKHAKNNLDIMDNLYFMAGSIIISEIDDTLAMVYNKEMADERNMEDVYELVRNNKWTIDKFAEMVTTITQDLNGDGEFKAGDDLFGYVQDPASMTYNWNFSSDLLKGYVDDSKTYQMNVDVNRVQTMLEKLSSVFNSNCALSEVDLYEGLKYFEENKIFMYAIILRNIELLREMDFDFGVIPYPMFDETQGEYLTHVGGASPILTIPLTNFDDDERLGYILETMAAASLQLVTPAYYETALKEKYSRDPESAEMLDIILDSRTYDLGYYAGASIVFTVSELIKQGTTDFTSQWARQETSIQLQMQRIIDQFTEN